MNVTIIVPSLNPDEKMVNTVRGILAEGFTDIVVVDDGSAAEYKEPFATVAAMEGVTVLTHEVNKGKGRAMKTAFAYIAENRPDSDGVVTVDGDGQHLPKDIRACAEAMVEQKDKVVLGVRDFSKPDVPFKSRNGNNITKAVFRIFCGIRISDTQTGLRAIPAKYLPLMCEIAGERYEYETNQLLILKDKKIALHEVVIETVYIDDNASSHFHPFRDSWRIYKIIFKHVGTSVLAKFLSASLVCFLIDTLLFFLINGGLESAGMGPEDSKLRIALATVGARVVSTVVNFCLNRKVVFKSTRGVGGTLVRYYILAICQMTASFLLVHLVAEKVFGLGAGVLESIVKFCVDMCLFVISYQVQKRWVFANKEQEGEFNA
ncbi:MAG: bifunctional glycosyltransferase family 2/GtrA family protein [Lachnospiraceae bacterium]|nr:bifunctional glycosyltransferase family 2/GtrA family protein [Lachnospiraceae bacterium]